MFRKILRKEQGKLKSWLWGNLTNLGYSCKQGDGWLYKAGTFPVLLVAHLDTVHKETPRKIVEKKGKLSSPQGIGGDDRCGVYMILEIIKKYDCPVLFLEDEEIGCVGAEKFIKTKVCKKLRGSFNYIIELDRKGKTDAVFYELDNAEFEDFITEKYWKSDWGSFTDICVIAPELDCAAVNLSCGYYKQHTKEEYIVLAEMEQNIKEVCKLLARTDEEQKFEWKELPISYKGSAYDWYKYGYGNDYGDVFWIGYYDENYCEYYTSVEAFTEEEAIGLFVMEYVDIPFKNVFCVERETELWGEEKCASK